MHRFIIFFCLLTSLIAKGNCTQIDDYKPQELYEIGKNLQDHNNYAKAICYYKKALAQNPYHTACRFNIGIAYLACHHTKKGFEYLDHYFQQEAPLTKQWAGQDLQEKSILVHIPAWDTGEIILLSRFIPLLHERGAKVQLNINNLTLNFYNSNPIFNITISSQDDHSYDITRDYCECDYEVHLASLPHLLKLKKKDVCVGNYLPQDQMKTMYWRQRCAIRNGSFNIGICFNNDAEEKSLSTLKTMLELISNVENVVLYNIGQELPEELCKNCSIIDASGNDNETTAVIPCMDCMITGENAQADLAAGYGIPVMVITDSYPSWRFASSTTDSFWYPTMKIFNPSRMNHIAFNDMCNHLKELITQKESNSYFEC